MSARRPLYDGPVIDAHHHLWDLSGGRYPWLTKPEAAIGALGDIGFLRRDYLPPDYAADTAGQGVAASVHVEAVWDPARSPIEETAWLDALPRPPGIAARYVVAAPAANAKRLGKLAAPEIAAPLDGHAASPRVAAVRETIRWHPDPAKRWTRQSLVNKPAWRRGLAQLARHGWALDLLMNPHQAEEVAALARDVPGQQFIVNHCGTPSDRDAEGLARWRAGLRAMGQRPNIAIKLSNYAAYATARTFEADRDTLRTCIDAFGPGRCMFGSGYPVSRRRMGYADLCARFRKVAAEYAPSEQHALFYGTAARLYGIAP